MAGIPLHEHRHAGGLVHRHAGQDGQLHEHGALAMTEAGLGDTPSGPVVVMVGRVSDEPRDLGDLDASGYMGDDDERIERTPADVARFRADMARIGAVVGRYDGDPFHVSGGDADLLRELASDLRELHRDTGISLDKWRSARTFVERFYGPIKDNGA